jgi:hypothetical protein
MAERPAVPVYLRFRESRSDWDRVCRTGNGGLLS